MSCGPYTEAAYLFGGLAIGAVVGLGLTAYFIILEYRRLFAETQPPRWVFWVTRFAAPVLTGLGMTAGYLLMPDC